MDEPEEFKVKSVELKLKRISDEIKKLEREHELAELSALKLKDECCPDVCTLINTLISSDESKLSDIEALELSEEAKLKEFKITKTKILAPIRLDKNYMKERISELERLKYLLKHSNICKC